MLQRFSLAIIMAITSVFSIAQGTETFTNIPANSGTYAVQNWTGDNGLAWSATDARTDQTMNGRAIVIRNGSVTSNNIPNGVASLSFDGSLSPFLSGLLPFVEMSL